MGLNKLKKFSNGGGSIQEKSETYRGTKLGVPKVYGFCYVGRQYRFPLDSLAFESPPHIYEDLAGGARVESSLLSSKI